MTLLQRGLPALCLLLALPGAAFGQALQSCERTGGTARADIMPATRHEALVQAGRLRRVVLTLANGQRTTTDFVPMEDAVSVRMITFPDPRDPARITAVFNRAVVEASGEMLVETWIRRPDAPGGAPVHNWYRLRCAPGGATK